MQKKTVALAAIFAPAVLLAAQPAMAYDPCVRATNEYKAASQRFQDYVDKHCPNGGNCYGATPYYQAVLDARARMAAACR